MSEFKKLSKEAIPAALEKAERYRLLNEPGEAESICLDVLRADPENQGAIVTLLLALTDRFSKGYGVSDTQAKEILRRITGEYERFYYSGLLAERQSQAETRHTGLPISSLRSFPRGDDMVRKGGSNPAAWQRRCVAALEHVCANY